MQPFKFETIYQSKRSLARVGKITTPHGVIDTPNFVAVGTNGTLKALDSLQVASTHLQLMFCNTYHLLLQPGTEIIKKAGGLHKFIRRDLPIITDSGGFQVFSLAYGSVCSELKGKGIKKGKSLVLKIDEEGVLFRSYRDGSKVFLTPESSIQAQKDLGADIIIPFDELPPYHIGLDELEKCLDRTHRWEQRSLNAHLKQPNGQAMYGVIHGGVHPHLRKKSCEYLTKLPFDGFSIGGSFGKTKEQMIQMLLATMKYLPPEKPNHLLGIADIDSLKACVPLGLDTFDSSYPTRAARHALLLSDKKNIKITSQKHKQELFPIEEGCDCFTCKHFTRAYLHHLFKANEITALSLASVHNLRFMVRFMERVRNQILNDKI